MQLEVTSTPESVCKRSRTPDGKGRPVETRLVRPPTCWLKPPLPLHIRLVKYGSVHYTDTRIYARIYVVHGEWGCCVRIFRQYTKSVHGSREPAGNFDLCS